MIRLTCLAFTAFALVACGGHGHDHEPGDGSSSDAHPEEGVHGGEILEIGDHVAHLEYLHDEEAGTITLYVYGADLKESLALAAAPQLKLNTEEGNAVFDMQPVNAVDGKASEFTVTDEALKMHGPEGRVSLTIDGKAYNPDIVHDHDH